MSTKTRPELSKKNKYWIEKHRYYELKHFCLQYPSWKRAYNSYDSLSKCLLDIVVSSKKHNVGDPVTKCVEARSYYSDKMTMVEKVARETDKGLSDYLLKAITEGLSYDCLKTRANIPCCKNVYYELYRRFFWLLNQERR